ncbi:MAG: tripartite tricarboxylate transporter substrate binding protein [Betaproteobacteria bacterium]|nr:tripartite tricarboxylate transporter substrate binding protein [Betaproteobacteria bacterium]
MNFALATLLSAAGAALGLTAALCPAQEYPVKPVRMIIPYPPGGGTDFFARTLGAKLSEAFGQPVVMENRAGAAGVIGADAAAKAAPDGYTIFIGQASNLAINPHLMTKLPYDPLRDFSPVSLVGGSPSLLVVHPSLPVHTVKDLVALARAKPGAIVYASAGTGSPGHISTEYFKRVAGIELLHVPYKGARPALTNVLAGEASLYFTSPVAAQPLVKAGRLRQVAVTSAKRFAPLPEVPTIAESGYPEIDIVSWWGLLTPANVPSEIVARLHAQTVKSMNAPETKDWLAKQGVAVMTNTPDEFAKFIRSEIDKWGRMVKASGARLD